jgi:hypothetical protein
MGSHCLSKWRERGARRTAMGSAKLVKFGAAGCPVGAQVVDTRGACFQHIRRAHGLVRVLGVKRLYAPASYSSVGIRDL